MPLRISLSHLCRIYAHSAYGSATHYNSSLPKTQRIMQCGIHVFKCANTGYSSMLCNTRKHNMHLLGRITCRREQALVNDRLARHKILCRRCRHINGVGGNTGKAHDQIRYLKYSHARHTLLLANMLLNAHTSLSLA